MNILIAYDSYRGHTEKLAQAIAEGADSLDGAEVRCLSVSEATEDDLLWADGVALGCPTHMGTMSWQMKKFIDTSFANLWIKNALTGKVGAVFTTGGSGGTGGAELTLLTLCSNLAQNGFVLITHPRDTPGYKPDGMHWGPVWATRSGGEPSEDHLLAARAHGRRLSEITGKLHGEAPASR